MIPILFENQDIVAADKPEGLASIPGTPGDEPCLLNLLSSQVAHRLYVIHRLDKEVSGVILFAKHPAAHKLLNDQFSERQVKKVYLALTYGTIEQQNGTIDRPLRQFGSGRMGVDPRRGKPSTTGFQVVHRRIRGYTLVNAFPVTGRRHQIRVHFYSLGHPIVGDPRYGDRALQAQFPRLMLHAQEITARLPSGEPVTIQSAIPESFRQLLAALEGGTPPGA